jgi:Ca-activated chloride channel family protein
LLIAHKLWQKDRTPAIRFSSLAGMQKLSPAWIRYALHALFGVRLIAIALLIVALARPQKDYTEEDILTEGVDIIIALDISGSMAAEDFSPRNRLYVAKEVVKNFIEGRRYDRIGMVVFSADSFTKCPLTLDYGVLIRLLDDVQLGTIRDGTAIGTALATSVNRLKPTKAQSKVIVLLTDGVNNTGEIDPLTAAEIAKAFAIKIYAIGVGSKGYAPFPVADGFGSKRYVQMPVEIDEKMLQEIAKETEGRYFRATDKKTLEDIFRTINSLEKSEVQVKSYARYDELFSGFLFAAMGLLLLEMVISRTRFQKLP